MRTGESGVGGGRGRCVCVYVSHGEVTFFFCGQGERGIDAVPHLAGSGVAFTREHV
jgi:hypothetical protein